jgi:uncharacterized damage-inducible protein DinB
LISIAHVRLMARYNCWQNKNLYEAADRLPDAARRKNCGAFFGSIHGTLSHLMWGDQIWMHRFDGWDKPPGGTKESSTLYPEWATMIAERTAFDQRIIAWSETVEEDWLKASMTWFSGAAGKEVTKENWFLVTHFFNHQTHHRGQVHAMLTAAGSKPQDTDLFYLN